MLTRPIRLRLEARQANRVPLDIYVNKLIDGVPHLTRTRNISGEGLYLHRLLEPEARPGARIALEFMLPGVEEVILTEAEVVHGRRSRRGMGVRFLDMVPRHREIIRQYIDRNRDAA